MALNIKAEDEICLRLSENDVRRSHFIEHLRDNMIAIEQTEPAIDNHRIMSIIFLTYCPKKQKNQRLGFQARIENITPDHLIFIRQLTTPFICDLRLWPRIHFDVLPKINAFCHDQEIQVVDVSGGGTHVVLRENDCAPPQIGTIVPMKFVFKDGKTNLKGEILRQWSAPTRIRHVAVRFVGQHNIQMFLNSSAQDIR